jgi:hypothetical protein
LKKNKKITKPGMSAYPTGKYCFENPTEIWPNYHQQQQQTLYYHSHHFDIHEGPSKASAAVTPAISYYPDTDFYLASTPAKRLKSGVKGDQAFLQVNTHHEFNSHQGTASLSGGSTSDTGSSQCSFSFNETSCHQGSSLGPEFVEKSFKNRQKRIVANERERTRMHK